MCKRREGGRGGAAQRGAGDGQWEGGGRWLTVQSKDVSALVKALDKNGDGTVDTQELVQVPKVLVVLGVLGPAGAHAQHER